MLLGGGEVEPAIVCLAAASGQTGIADGGLSPDGW
jgi:hypothetical protein